MANSISEIVFPQSGGAKNLKYEFKNPSKCSKSTVTIAAPEWMNPTHDAKEKIYSIQVDETDNKRQGKIEFFIDGEPCTSNTITVVQSYACSCSDATFEQKTQEFPKVGITVDGTVICVYDFSKDCENLVHGEIIDSDKNVYDLIQDSNRLLLGNNVVKHNEGKEKTWLVNVYYSDLNKECTSFTITQEGEILCDCEEVEVHDVMESFPSSGLSATTVIGKYSIQSKCDGVVTASIRGGSFLVNTPLTCENGDIKLRQDIPVNGETSITYNLSLYYNGERCDSLSKKITQDGVVCDCTDIKVNLISTISPRGLKIGDIIGTYDAKKGCNVNYVSGFIYEGTSSSGVSLQCDGGYIRLTEKIDYNVGTTEKNFTVKIFYRSNECQTFTLTQDSIQCECTSMDFFVGTLKTTFPLSGTGDNYVEVATGNTLDCGSLSATCKVTMLDGGDIRTEYDEEAKTYHYYAKVLPSGENRSAAIRFYFKGKDSSEFIECNKIITILQTSDYSYCVDIIPKFDYEGDKPVLKVSQFGKTNFEAINFTPRSLSGHNYVIESSESWLGFNLVEDRTNGDKLFFIVERNDDDATRSGTITIQQWLDAKVVEDGGVEILMDGVMCMESAFTVIQDGYEEVTCDTDDLYYSSTERDVSIDDSERVNWSMFAPFQTHSSSLSAITVDESGQPYAYDWINISSIVKQDEYKEEYGNGTFGSQFKINFNISKNSGNEDRTAHVKVFSLVNGAECDDEGFIFHVTQKKNECIDCAKDKIYVYNTENNYESKKDCLLCRLTKNCGQLSGVTTSDDWIQNITYKGDLMYDITENDTDEIRNGVVRVYIVDEDGNNKYGEDCYKDITITQGINDCANCTTDKIELMDYSIDSNEFKEKIIARYNSRCGRLSSYTLSDGSDWLASYPYGFDYIRISGTTNESYQERTATVRLYIANSMYDPTDKYGNDCYKDVVITQPGKPCDCNSYELSVQTEGYAKEITMGDGNTYSIGFINGLIPSDVTCLSITASSTSDFIDSVWREEDTENNGYVLKLKTNNERADTAQSLTVDVKLINGDTECKWIRLEDIKLIL